MRTGRSSRDQGTDLLEPLAELPADEPLVPHDLHDALADEEVVDPTIDVYQVREILERTSRHPFERSIPPANVASNRVPDQARATIPVGISHLVGLVGAALLVGAATVMLITRQPQNLAEAHTNAPGVVSNHLGEVLNSVTIAAPKEPTPPVATRIDTTLQDERRGAERQSAPVVIAEGSLDVRLLLSKLQRALPMFDEQCWDRLRAPVGEVAKNPSLRISMGIDRWGHVREIESSQPPPGYRGVGHCIIGRMRGWKFPKADEGTRAVITVTRSRD